MEENKDYIKGFNDGYLLEQYETRLTERLLSSLKGQNDYEIGFIEASELQQERRLAEDLLSLRNNRNNRDTEKDLSPGRE